MGGRVPPPYPPEIRAEAIRLVRDAGISPRDVAETASCSAETVRARVKQDERDRGVRADGLTTDERAESWVSRARDITPGAPGRRRSER